MVLEKKIIEAFQMAPVVYELEQGAGYLHLEEVAALKKVKMDFRTKCQDIALRYLKQHSSTVASKNAASADIRRVQAGTTADDPDVDLSPLFDILQMEVNEAIDREGGRSELARNALRGVLMFPAIVRFAAVALVCIMIIMAARDLFFK